jgi:hypothetical protein
MALLLALLVTTGPTVTGATRQVPDHASPPGVSADERLGGLALDLGFDLERIFRFVADEIRYEPYAGVLRGALGTLDAGAGNSLDQALLLGALLDESGIDYRFARGTLADPDAARLVETARLDPTEAATAAEIAFGGGPYPARIQMTQMAPPDPRQLASIEAAAHAALAESDEHVADSVRLLGTALQEAGVALGSGSQEDPSRLLPPGEVTGHTWLQVAQGPDWLDADTTLGVEAILGDALAETGDTLEALPDALRHVVRFEVMLERVRGAELQAEPLVQYTGFADELAGESITLAHIQPSAVRGLGVAIDSLSGSAALSYYPILLVPEGTLVSSVGVSFDVDTGQPDLSDVFGAASPGPLTLGDGEAVAEWIEVTVESPGTEPVTERRTVFDRVPAMLRQEDAASVADVQPIELVAWAADGGQDFASLLGTESFAVTTRPANEPDMLARALAPDAEPTAILAESYLGIRDVAAAQLSQDDGVVAYVDRPGVVSFRVDVASDGTEPSVTYGLDIWHRSLGAMPARGSAVSHAEANVMAGVVEHVAERTAMGVGVAEPGSASPSVGVSAVFEAAAGAGVPTLVLRGSIPSAMSLTPHARALIEGALRAGDVVVIPAEPVPMAGRERMGWWRIDPVTGSTVDTMDDGTASEMVEITPILRMQLCAAVFLPAVGQILSVFFDGVASKILNFISGAATAFWIWQAANVPRAVAACMTGA